MKRSVRILSLLLALFSLLALSSCGNTEVTKKFSRGTVSGDVYTSTYAGFTFTKPADWVFLTDEEIAATQGTVTEIFDADKFEEMTEGSVIDMFAQAATNDSLNISFSKGTAFTDLEKSVEASVAEIKTAYESLGWAVTVSDEKTVTVAGREMQKVEVGVDAGVIAMKQYCYFFKIGVYICSIAATTLDNYTDAQFEAMFSQVEEAK